ncbi:cysteine hydrolase family protein [Flammeovirgaceae bacterium SG7u.111]|nr:cysteine hydrolase family protein [Flammeovirgaceae bacterium SG7u.132]WPO37509.1 cysteine hydrolase family protein [Flammeovirgaceae bacterium SG7u.111]
MSFKEKTALLLVDIQQGFDDIAYWGGHRNNLDAEENAGKILGLWRSKGMPVFHIKHCSTNPESKLAKGLKGNEIQDIVKPLATEPILEKSVNSGFIGTGLKERLDKEGIDSVVIVGLTTDHCISTTTRMAANLGFTTYLVSDATATFDKVGPNGEKYSAELIHETAIASLHEEFATILNTEKLMDILAK